VVDQQLQRVAGDRQRHPERVREVGDDQVGGLLRPGRADPHQRHEHHPVAMAARLPGGPGGRHLQGKPGLADPARAHEGHQPAGGVVEQLVQARKLPLPADERGERPGQVRARRAHWAPRRRSLAQLGEPFGAGDLLAQGDRGRRRLDGQLLPEHVPAGLVLRERGAALAAGGQEPHERPVRLLLQRLQLQHAAGDLDPGGRVPAVARELDGAVHQREHVGPGRGPPPHQPFVEQRGAGDLEALQELAAAQPHGRQQVLAAVPRGGGHAGHLNRIDPDRTAGSERDRLPGHLQVLREDAAQLAQHQPQVGPGGRLRQVAPQQPGKRRARVPVAGHRQVHQQRRRLGRDQLD
jgi:hypothetical protein